MGKQKKEWPYNLLEDIVNTEPQPIEPIDPIPEDFFESLEYVLQNGAKPREVTILKMYYEQQLSKAEIGRRLEISLQRVAEILKQQLNVLRQDSFMEYLRYGIGLMKARREAHPEETSIYELQLDTRTKNALAKAGITTIADLLKVNGQEFVKMPGLGRACRSKIIQILEERGYDCANKVVGVGNPRNLTGQRFGMLTAIRPTEQREHRNVVWECRCDCGNTAFVRAAKLLYGEATSCGCNCGKPKDLTGQKFGMLTAIRPTEQREHRNVVWECRCDCGNTAFVRAASLLSGHTKSCGCMVYR